MKFSKLVLLLSSLTVSLGATAGERLYLQTPATFAQNAPVIPRIKAECDLEREMAVGAEAGISKRYSLVTLATRDEDVGNDKVVKVTILSVDGIGGGSWTGGKSMTIKAELTQGETVLRSKTFQRESGHSGLFGGTCDILHKVTRALGADVGVWLKKTTDDPT